MKHLAQLPSKWPSWDCIPGVLCPEPTLASVLSHSMMALEAWDYFVYPAEGTAAVMTKYTVTLTPPGSVF